MPYKIKAVKKDRIYIKIDFEDRWFQVFDYLSRNHNIFVPVNNEKFKQFIKILESEQPGIYRLLCKHLEEYSAEKILNLLFEYGKDLKNAGNII